MIHSFIFNNGKVVAENLDPDALRLVKADKGLVIWVDLHQPTDEETKIVLEHIFQFHPLAIEDCVTSSPLPKIEDYEDYFFMTIHAVGFSKTEKFSTSELDLFLGKEFLVTYHKVPIAPIEHILDRFLKRTAQLVRGPDRLAHMIFDGIMDQYTPAIDDLTEELEKLEDDILDPQKKISIGDILEMRKLLSDLRQIVRPQREIINRLARGGNKLIRPTMLPYFRDLSDILTRIDETVRNYTERLVLDFDVYMNRSSNEANEGIKVLTALTAITLPPVIIGSWYGMNFKNMPELNTPLAYWLAMVITVGGMIFMWFWLKSKKWF